MKSVSLWADAWKRLRKNKMAFISLWVVLAYILVALVAPVLPIYPYEEQVVAHANLPPSFRKAGDVLMEQRVKYFDKVMQKEGRTSYNEAEQAEIDEIKASVNTPVYNRHYILGTDALGRDMLSRTIYGGRISIAIGLIGTITALLIGIMVGSVAGYIGGWQDNILMRFVDIMYGLPYMLMVIIMMAILGRNVAILFVAIALVSWLTIARVVRGQVISLKASEYVQAARAMGATTSHIIFRHLLPNTLGIIIAYATLSLPEFIMSESFLSFLGLGVSAPLASWGSLVSDGVKGMELYPWILVVPAITMTVFLFAMNFLGDGVRDAFDPQSKNRV
ncbi:ABC transporter permease [Treponema zioleckii]|uniref:ABC transporter permease n=1 Tax=Treponema zioleckii TaxID=331680 RepID=UPI001F5B8809|nr:ABC transporter permease [Treponema zioleckii]